MKSSRFVYGDQGFPFPYIQYLNLMPIGDKVQLIKEAFL